MKTLYILFSFLFALSYHTSSAQVEKTETFNVLGNCGMCKNNIEKAAKAAGASYADWNMEAKKLTVKYTTNTTLAKIQQSIAHAGYDNAGSKASDAAYNKLHSCCQYDRQAKMASTCCDKNEACCKNDKQESCCKK